MNLHKMEPEEAEKLVPEKLCTNPNKAKHKVCCPLCEHSCVPLMLRKHIFNSHKELTIEEINMVFEEAVNPKHDPKANSNNKAGGILDDDLENNPLFSKVQPDGRIKCKAPECK